MPSPGPRGSRYLSATIAENPHFGTPYCRAVNARIARITVSVADFERAKRLYLEMLGLTPLYALPGMAMLASADGIQVQLHERPPTPGDAGVAVSFGVTDVDSATIAAVAAGASIVKEPADQPWGERQSVLRDADGHILCLVAPLVSR